MAQVYKFAGIEAAKIAGRSGEMDVVAHKLVALARANAAKHADSGKFGRSIRVRNVPGKRGVRDRLVEATDPNAASKELGHVIRNEKGGPILGYVKGQHSMGKAVAQIPAVKGD